eukprot:TRINITY_DN1625_c1_g3_i10.p1 TRINITY_DN1625_c1_g3~~TRINITY_DN1625_c1_g3_i10.p1  ORF type:complete len:111 (-),score=27.54 TRINITY_DN1625_c1_g3_i10:997-1329(-)
MAATEGPHSDDVKSNPVLAARGKSPKTPKTDKIPKSPKTPESPKGQATKAEGQVLQDMEEEDLTDEGHGLGVYRGYEGEASTVRRKKAPGMFERVKEELQAIWTAIKPSK